MKINLLSITALLLLFALWISPGLFGRDPWKADEPYTFGLVNHMIESRDYVVPMLTGETFLEKPPAYFVVAALFGKVFSPPLERLDAMRLASAFYMLLAFLFFALAARELYGREYAMIAAVLLLGCVHLQEIAHKLITDVALFAGFSVALYGLALSARRNILGGFWLGTGIGLGFMSKGLIAPGVLGITALLLPALFAQWRRKEYAVSLGASFVAILPWLIVWPALLYARSPEYFIEWFWDQNLGRFLGFGVAGGVGSDSHAYYLLNLIWLGWPVILPALWSLWYFRKSWREHAVFQIPLVSSIVMLLVLSVSSTNRAIYAMPLILPLTLLAVAGIYHLPLKAKIIANRASVLLFGCAALLLWFGWLTLMIGSPAVLAQKLHTFKPDYIPAINSVLVTIAALYTLAWLFTVIKLTRSPEHAVLNWTLGIVLTWALIMTLWLPALNSGSSYRAAFTELKKVMPAEYTCLATQGIGESERAMLAHFSGLQFQRSETRGLGDCDLLLEQRGGGSPISTVGQEWEKVWETKRPSIRPKDYFTLFRKVERE